MSHFLYDAGLDFVAERLEVDVGSAPHDVEGGI